MEDFFFLVLFGCVYLQVLQLIFYKRVIFDLHGVENSTGFNTLVVPIIKRQVVLVEILTCLFLSAGVFKKYIFFFENSTEKHINHTSFAQNGN